LRTPAGSAFFQSSGAISSTDRRVMLVRADIGPDVSIDVDASFMKPMSCSASSGKSACITSATSLWPSLRRSLLANSSRSRAISSALA
jgi:hypothetical protein